ncbi:MAG TPA: phosphatidylinositol-specific phospholipase C domain-containing protein, partial [Pyrinomonadaceae bacterium]|nr:phosphatidylinositol-specific phospholipase C domain-containing protein [Pyrinomonadaceae bacterium]
MSDNAAILGKKQLNEIALPGAHDAGTFAITASKNTGITFGDSDGLSSPDNKKVKQFLSIGSIFSDWAKTQERTTAQMLADGIRYFDIRVCVDNKGILMTCHGLYGASVASMLDDIKTFTGKNPREVVLLGFNHFWERAYQIEQGKKQGEIEGLTKAKWTELVNLVKTKLNGKLVSSQNFSPQSKLSELWQLKNNNQVIALFDSDAAPDDVFVWKRMEENTWVEGWDIDQFKSGTLKVLENAKNKQYAGKFYAVRSSVTPDDNGKLISMGFLSDVYPKSASELADMTNPVALGWIKNEWAGKYPVNLLWADFYDRADLVKLAKYLNGIKVDFKGTKIGTATNWTKWKSAEKKEK